MYLSLGLLLFLGAHSVRIFAEGWRNRQQATLGAPTWRAAYSMVSVLGLILIIWGFGMARQTPVQLWSPPVAMRHLAGLLTLLSFVLLAGAYVPGNLIKARVHHPMVAGVKLWAFAHLLANGNAAHVLLFGSFLAWAALDFLAARRRDRRDNVPPIVVKTGATGLAVALGMAAWMAFAFWLHGLLMGVRPFG